MQQRVEEKSDMSNRLFFPLGLLLLMYASSCVVFQSSYEEVNPRQEFCEIVIDYCLLYPDTFQRVKLLEEEHGLQLSLPNSEAILNVCGFRNYVYMDIRGWYETEIRELEAAHESVEVLESNYTDDYLRMQLIVDDELQLVQVYRLDRERWVVARFLAEASAETSPLQALFEQVDVIPGTLKQ